MEKPCDLDTTEPAGHDWGAVEAAPCQGDHQIHVHEEGKNSAATAHEELPRLPSTDGFELAIIPGIAPQQPKRSEDELEALNARLLEITCGIGEGPDDRCTLSEVERLLEQGADPNIADEYQTPLIWASRRNRSDIVQALLANGAVLDAVDIRTQTALTKAATEGLSEIAHMLLEAGAAPDPWMPDFEGHTPLIKAAIYNRVEVTDMLLKRHANMEAVDTKEQQTPLHRAARHNHFHVARLLLQAGANPDALDVRRRTPLSWACQFGHLEVVETLLAAEPKPKLEIRELLHPSETSQGCNGNTALTWAAWNGHPAVVRALLKAGASHQTPGWGGRTALVCAARRNAFALAEKRKAVVAEINGYWSSSDSPDPGAARRATWSPLNENAARRDLLEVVQVLLEAGANPDATDQDGYTALNWAQRNGYTEMAQALRDAKVARAAARAARQQAERDAHWPSLGRPPAAPAVVLQPPAAPTAATRQPAVAAPASQAAAGEASPQAAAAATPEAPVGSATAPPPNAATAPPCSYAAAAVGPSGSKSAATDAPGAPGSAQRSSYAAMASTASKAPQAAAAAAAAPASLAKAASAAVSTPAPAATTPAPTAAPPSTPGRASYASRLAQSSASGSSGGSGRGAAATAERPGAVAAAALKSASATAAAARHCVAAAAAATERKGDAVAAVRAGRSWAAAAAATAAATPKGAATAATAAAAPSSAATAMMAATPTQAGAAAAATAPVASSHGTDRSPMPYKLPPGSQPIPVRRPVIAADTTPTKAQAPVPRAAGSASGTAPGTPSGSAPSSSSSGSYAARVSFGSPASGGYSPSLGTSPVPAWGRGLPQKEPQTTDRRTLPPTAQAPPLPRTGAASTAEGVQRPQAPSHVPSAPAQPPTPAGDWAQGRPKLLQQANAQPGTGLARPQPAAQAQPTAWQAAQGTYCAPPEPQTYAQGAASSHPLKDCLLPKPPEPQPAAQRRGQGSAPDQPPTPDRQAAPRPAALALAAAGAATHRTALLSPLSDQAPFFQAPAAPPTTGPGSSPAAPAAPSAAAGDPAPLSALAASAPSLQPAAPSPRSLTSTHGSAPVLPGGQAVAHGSLPVRAAQPARATQAQATALPSQGGGEAAAPRPAFACPLCAVHTSGWALLTCRHHGPCEECCQEAVDVVQRYPTCAKCGAATDTHQVLRMRMA